MKRKIPICVKHILWYTSFANACNTMSASARE